MKKRIIALILVVVMGVLALVGCEYNYSNAKLSKFTTVDTYKLEKALKNLKIADGEFTTDEEERKHQTWDLIYRSLANADNADATENKEGTPDAIDLLYYCYYAVAEVDGKEHIFTFKNSKGYSYMLTKYATYLQYGLYSNEDDALTKAIIAAMEGKDIKDYVYENDTSTSTEVDAGDFVLVTFTYNYTDEEGKITKKTVENLPLYVPAADGEYTVPAALAELVNFAEFAAKLDGIKVGKTQSTLYQNPEESADKDDDKTEDEGNEETKSTVSVKYTDVKVNAVLTGAALNAPAVTYPLDEDADEDEKENLVADIFGEEVDLTDVEIKYQVYPVYYKNVTFGAEEILTIFYGSEITTDALDILASEDYKIEYTDDEGNPATKTLKKLIEEFAVLQETYEKAKAAYDKAVSNLESAEEALEEAKQDVEDAKKTLEDAKKRLEDAKADKIAKKDAYDEAQAKYDEATAEGSAATDDEIAALKKALDDAKKEYDEAVTEESDAEKYVAQSDKNLNGDPEDEKDKGLLGDLEEAEADYDEAYEALYGKKTEDNDGGEATVADEEEEEEKEEEKKSASETFEEAKSERDNQLELIFLAKAEKEEGSEEEPKSVKDALVDDFYNACYENLEDSYFEEINKAIITEIYKAIKSYITVDLDKLPKRAVNEAYKKIYDSHKSKFFNSASSTASTTLYETYGGDYELYLMTETKTTTFKAAKESLKQEAREYVAEIMRIYKAAEVLGYVYTNDEFKADYKEEYNEYLAEFYSYYGMEYMTEESLRNARQADKLFNGLLEISKDADGRPETDENGIYKYKNIKYSLKAD